MVCSLIPACGIVLDASVLTSLPGVSQLYKGFSGIFLFLLLIPLFKEKIYRNALNR